MSSDGLLMIFVKNPKKGRVKTRLAEKVGDRKALELYEAMLKHTKKITEPLPYQKMVYYDRYIEEGDLWEGSSYLKALQPSGDLGRKMASAFKGNFIDYHKLVIIGSDCPELQTSDIQAAFDVLNDHDFVIGPAEDGGYYLLGMKWFSPSLFKHINWSTSTVLEETIKTINRICGSYYLLRTLNDIDTYEDLVGSEWYNTLNLTVE